MFSESAKPVQRPLKIAQLNAFFEAVHASCLASALNDHSLQTVMIDLADDILPAKLVIEGPYMPQKPPTTQAEAERVAAASYVSYYHDPDRRLPATVEELEHIVAARNHSTRAYFRMAGQPDHPDGAEYSRVLDGALTAVKSSIDRRPPAASLVKNPELMTFHLDRYFEAIQTGSLTSKLSEGALESLRREIVSELLPTDEEKGSLYVDPNRKLPETLDELRKTTYRMKRLLRDGYESSGLSFRAERIEYGRIFDGALAAVEKAFGKAR